MKTMIKITTIMLTSAVFFWGGFPAGLAFKFPLLLAGAITIAGAEVAVLLVLAMGSPLQRLLLDKFPTWTEKTRSGKAGKIWQKYGMPGLGLISPVVPGAPQSALLALVLGAKPGWILLWVSAGILMWGGFVITGLYFGIDFASQLIK